MCHLCPLLRIADIRVATFATAVHAFVLGHGRVTGCVQSMAYTGIKRLSASPWWMHNLHSNLASVCNGEGDFLECFRQQALFVCKGFTGDRATTSPSMQQHFAPRSTGMTCLSGHKRPHHSNVNLAFSYVLARECFIELCRLFTGQCSSLNKSTVMHTVGTGGSPLANLGYVATGLFTLSIVQVHSGLMSSVLLLLLCVCLNVPAACSFSVSAAYKCSLTQIKRSEVTHMLVDSTFASLHLEACKLETHVMILLSSSHISGTITYATLQSSHIATNSSYCKTNHII
jgi:hypothetical protein